MAHVVKAAQATIEETWPEHAKHKSGTRHARWSTAEGIVCACGDVLGWPDPDHHETLSQYTKRIAAEQVDAASAPGRVQGAFGSYASQPTEPEPSTYAEPAVREAVSKAAGHWPVGATDNTVDVREPGDYPEPEQESPSAHDDDPGPGEPPDDPWADTPDNEPEPEPWPAAPVAEESAPVDGPVDFAKLADEAQTKSDIPPWTDDTDDGSDCAVPECGTSHAPGSEFCDDHGGAPDAIPSNEGIPTGGEVAVREEPGVGQEIVPFAGTPIFPGEAQTLDPLVDRLDPLDPTLPYTPQDVELKIVDIMRAVDRSELFLRQQIAREHAATHNLDFRYNLAIAQSDAKAADQRKAEAWIATERERFEATEASMLVRALRDAQHNLRSVLSGYQSVARSLGVSLTNSLDGRRTPPAPPLPQEPPPDPWTN